MSTQSGARQGIVRTSLETARSAPVDKGRLSSLLFTHGSLQLRFYVPLKPDPQSPHDQDELYVVADGQGVLVSGDDRYPVGRGDALFVSAGVEHHFEDTSANFGTWVVFYGPHGGELTE